MRAEETGEDLGEQLSSEWTVAIARSFEEIERFREAWRQMQCRESAPALNADIDRYSSVVKSKGPATLPCVIVLCKNGTPEAMVIGRIEERPIACRLGYKTMLQPLMRCLTVIHGGVLGQPSEQMSARLCQELTRLLKQGEVDAVFFNRLRFDSPLYNQVRTGPAFLCRSRLPVVEPHWRTRLPGVAEASVKSKSKSRKRYIRRYSKALEKACSGPVEMKCYRREDELDHVIDIAREISSKTYKHALNVGFRDDDVTRLLLTEAARRGRLRAYVLYAGGRPCAFEYGTEYRNTFFPEHIGYDPALSSCSPGTVLFIKVLEDLQQDLEVGMLDYGFGAATYKKRFGTEFWPEASIYIFAPRAYPVLVNVLRSSVAGLSWLMVLLLKSTGLTGWAKRQWRNLLRARKCDSSSSKTKMAGHAAIKEFESECRPGR
jgi:hypothetical protein